MTTFSRIKNTNPRSAVTSIYIDTEEAIWNDSKKLYILEHAPILANGNDCLSFARRFAYNTELGVGRSVQAFILGLEYKDANRLNASSVHRFARNLFALPQDGDGMLSLLRAYHLEQVRK